MAAVDCSGSLQLLPVMGLMKKGLFGCSLKHQVAAISLTYCVSSGGHTDQSDQQVAGTLGRLDNLWISTLSPPREVPQRHGQLFRSRKEEHFHGFYL